MRKAWGILILVVVMSLVTSVLAFADDKEAVVQQFIKDNCKVEGGNIQYQNSTLKSYIKEKADNEYNRAVVLSDGKTVVYYRSADLDILYRQAQKDAENKKVAEKVNAITDNLSVEANTGGAAVMLSGFQPIVELIMGLIIIMVIFGMGLFSAMDIAYIAFPVFRNKCEDMKQTGNVFMTKKTSSGDVKLRWVTDEAQYAVAQAAVDGGKSPWGIYLRKRAAAYVLLGIALYILMTNNIWLITNLAVRAVGGIIRVLSGL